MPSNRKQLNRQRLLDQGVALLLEKGYHGVGLKEILDSVGIPKGSFYNYFDSKEQFCIQVISHYLSPFMERLSALLAEHPAAAHTALDIYLHEQIDCLQQSGFRGGCLLGNLMAELGDISASCRGALRDCTGDYRDLLARAFAEGQAQGYYRQDLSAEFMADLLLNSWQGAMLRMKVEQSCEPLRQVWNTLMDDYFLCKNSAPP